MKKYTNRLYLNDSNVDFTQVQPKTRDDKYDQEWVQRNKGRYGLLDKRLCGLLKWSITGISLIHTSRGLRILLTREEGDQRKTSVMFTLSNRYILYLGTPRLDLLPSGDQCRVPIKIGEGWRRERNESKERPGYPNPPCPSLYNEDQVGLGLPHRETLGRMTSIYRGHSQM